MSARSLGRIRRGMNALRACFMLAAVVTFGIAVWLWLRPNSATLVNQGLAKILREPASAEQLFRRALDASDPPLPDAQLGLCLAFARQQRWNDGQKLFHEIDLSQCRPRILLEFGREAIESNHIDEARGALEELARRNVRESPDAMDLLVSGYRRWGLQNELLAVAREITQHFPDRFDIWGVEVEALRAMKLENECLEAAREALRHDPPEEYRREFQFLVVEMQINHGELADAVGELQKLQELEGESFRARACAASIFRLERRFDEALKTSQTLFGDPRTDATAHMIRGIVFLDRGDFEKAVADLKQAVAAQPFNTQAHFKLSESYRALGKSAEALTHSRLANELSAKRLQINSLLKQRATQRESDREISRQLVRLFEDIGDAKAAAFWRREAGPD